MILDNIIAIPVGIGEKTRRKATLHEGGEIRQSQRRLLILGGILEISPAVILGVHVGVGEEQIRLDGAGGEAWRVAGRPAVKDAHGQVHAALLQENVVEEAVALMMPLEESSHGFFKECRGIRREIIEIHLRKTIVLTKI